jgi:hypothetical protein
MAKKSALEIIIYPQNQFWYLPTPHRHKVESGTITINIHLYSRARMPMHAAIGKYPTGFCLCRYRLP